MNRYYLIVILFLCTSLNSICQTWNQTNFIFPTKATLSDENYRTIIISEILNEKNRVTQNSRDIYDELANRISQVDDLLLVDRQKTESLLSEFEFQQSSGLVNKTYIKELGEFYSSGVLAFVRIQRAKYNDEVKSITKWVVVNGCGTTKFREANFDLSINLKLIDLKTGSVVFSKNIEANPKKKSKGYDCKTPPKFNKDELYKESLKIIGIEFQKLFEDYETKYTIEFQKHPKINADLKKAITYFNINELQTGYETLVEISTYDLNDKARSSALYNLALVQFYLGKTSESLSNAKKAYILNPNNSDCLKIINSIE